MIPKCIFEGKKITMFVKFVAITFHCQVLIIKVSGTSYDFYEEQEKMAACQNILPIRFYLFGLICCIRRQIDKVFNVELFLKYGHTKTTTKIIKWTIFYQDKNI